MSSVEWADVQESYNYQRTPQCAPWEELSEFARKVWRLKRRWIQSADFAGPPDPLPFAKKLRKMVIKELAVVEVDAPWSKLFAVDVQHWMRQWQAVEIMTPETVLSFGPRYGAIGITITPGQKDIQWLTSSWPWQETGDTTALAGQETV